MSYLFDELSAKDQEKPVEDKILLMGLQQAGKTAIKDVVFFGKQPDDVVGYMATVHYERQFIGENKDSLIIDSGGQESYWNEAVTHFRHLVFSNVKLLLWIVDMTRPDLFEESERRFSFTIRQFKKENPDGRIAVLCHKVDQVNPENLVNMLEEVKKEFDDKKFKIRFEATSIYYHESLKELMDELMAEANLNIKRFELITNIGQKLEETDEFQSYVVEHRDDPRIRQLLGYLNPEPDRTLPTYGTDTVDLDLSDYNIIEIVLIDKETFTPVTGTSSRNVVDIDQTMDYIIALNEFKDAIKTKQATEDTTMSVVTSSNNKVHGLIVDLVSKFLLITSFSEITPEKTQVFYQLIRKFASSLDPTTKAVKTTTVAPSASVKPTVKEPTQKPVATPPVKTPIVKEPVPTSAPVAPVEAPAPITIEADKALAENGSGSRFSFLNALKEEVLIEEGHIPGTEEPVEEIVAPAPKPEPVKVVEEPVAVESATEPKVVVEEQTKPIAEAPVAEVVKEVAEEVKEPAKPVSKLPWKRTPTKATTPKPATEEPAKSKSRFVQRLKEEGKRYLIRQVEITQASDAEEEKLSMSEEEVQDMVKFLAKASTSETADETKSK